MHKIIITGGHHTSALVVAKKLLKKSYQVYWFGHRHTINEDRSLSAEYRQVTAAGIPFYELKADSGTADKWAAAGIVKVNACIFLKDTKFQSIKSFSLLLIVNVNIPHRGGNTLMTGEVFYSERSHTLLV